MDKWQIHSVSDLATGLMQFYTQPPIHASTGDALAIEWVCDVLNNGAAATLTGSTATVYAIREDGATAMTSATISGNKITAVLPDAFFDVRGVVRAVMKLIDETNNAEMTVSEMSFKVGQGATDDIVDSDDIISIREGLIAIAQLPQTLAGKQDTLIAGSGISIASDGKTISATGGSGGTDANAVHYTAEAKTDAQKAQARTNIGAISGVIVDGVDLTPDSSGKVTIPNAGTSSAGVVRVNAANGSETTDTGQIRAARITLTNYASLSNAAFIGKGTLESIREDFVKRSLTTNSEITDADRVAILLTLGCTVDTDGYVKFGQEV